MNLPAGLLRHCANPNAPLLAFRAWQWVPARFFGYDVVYVRNLSEFTACAINCLFPLTFLCGAAAVLS